MVVRDNASAPPLSRRAKPKRANCCSQPFSFRLSGPAQLISPPSLGLFYLIAIAILRLYIVTYLLCVEYSIDTYPRPLRTLDDLADYCSFISTFIDIATIASKPIIPSDSTLSALINYQSISHGAYHRVGDLTRSPVLS